MFLDLSVELILVGWCVVLGCSLRFSVDLVLLMGGKTETFKARPRTFLLRKSLMNLASSIHHQTGVSFDASAMSKNRSGLYPGAQL